MKKIHLLILFFVLILVSNLNSQETEQKFFIHYDVPLVTELGDGIMVFTLMNNTEEDVKDIIIKLPEQSSFHFGVNSRAQAGVLAPGGQTAVQDTFFDPEKIYKSGIIELLIEYRDSSNTKQEVLVIAIGEKEEVDE